MDKEEKRKLGKKSRAEGKAFEIRVRKDLEKKDWICDRWTNNVEFTNLKFFKKGFTCSDSKIVPAKPKFIWNPKTKSRQMISNSSGFPDFVCFKNLNKFGYFTDFRKETSKNKIVHEVIGVECKINGYLDKEERAKCAYYLTNNVFSKILIASKGEKRGEVKYDEFQIKKL